MTDDFEFDPLESELRRRFDTLEPAREDPEAVLDAMRPRLRRAQRNHRILTSAAATFVVVVALVVGLAAFRGSDTGRIRVTPPASQTPSASTTTTTTTVPPDQGMPNVSTPDGADDSGPTGAAPTGGTQPEPTGTSAPTGDTAPEPAPESTTTPPSSDTPYTSPGGSIVVHRSGSTISLGSSAPAAGYTQEVQDNGPTRAEVRFNNGQTEWRIRVDLVNGELQAETTQH
jgi:hypothetical protein